MDLPEIIRERPWEILCTVLSDERRSRMLEASLMRTLKIRLVLYDTYHAHNVSACIRSAEAFGIDCIDLVGGRKNFRPTGVTKGVERWIDITRYQTISECKKKLVANNFRIAAACLKGDFPSIPQFTLETLPVDRPIALVFGNEKEGIASSWREHLDATFTIPMFGLVESLNVSVCAGIALYQVAKRMGETMGSEFRVNSEERREILDRWIKRHFPHWQGLMKRISESSNLP